MDNKQIIIHGESLITSDEIYHWGIKGMKWGIRRYQNPDGSLTEKGKKRYTNPDGTLNKKGEKKFGNSVKDVMRKKTAKDMTDEELDRAIIRAKKEDEYNRLRPEPTNEKKKSVLMNDIIKPAAVNAGKNLVSKMMNMAVEKLTAGKVDPNSYEYMKKYYDKLKIKKDIDDLVNPKEKELSWDDRTKKYNLERQMKKDAEADKKAEAEAKAAKKAVKESDKETDNDDSDSVERRAHEVERIINDYSKKSASAAYDTAYEKRVDEMLAEMDDRGWEMYYRDYAKRDDD